ncbi:MAG: hypothetical protein JOZ47_09685 [Kutzneria sp.]|nr:hypothetical protein [Kutzneria sp.]
MTALIVTLGFVVLAVVLGLRARRGKDMNLDQWAVAGRGFGGLFVFLLMAGEIYTTFTFLGAPGWAYGKGAPALYIICYGAVAYLVSYWLLPAVWRFATRNNLHSQADFFVAKFDSPGLGVLVTLVGVIALVPYLVLQLRGLGLIMSEASYGHVSYPVAVVIGTSVLALYVTVSGVHGSAWTAVVKDGVVLVVVLALGIYLPWHYFGGVAPMFRAVNAARPGFLTLPSTGMSPSWFVSTVLLSALGFYMWPHPFSASYTARDERVFRRNAIVLPAYQLILLFVFFVGFAAVLVVPGLKGSDGDLSLLRITTATFDPWFVGVVGGAGVLTALVPGSLILTTAATMLAKNIYKLARPTASDASISLAAKLLVPLLALVALYLTFDGGGTIVSLLLVGYSIVTQLFPALLLSLSRRALVTRSGAVCGIVAGVAVVAVLTLSGLTLAGIAPWLPRSVTDLNVGVVALVVNLVVLVVVTLLTRRRGVLRSGATDAVSTS